MNSQPDPIKPGKYNHIRLPSDLIDPHRFDHITDPGPEDYEAIKADHRKLEVQAKALEILSPLFRTFQNDNEKNQCAKDVARKFQEYIYDIKGVDPEAFAERHSIALAVLARYWPAAYEQAIQQLALFIFNNLKNSFEYGYACLTALAAEERRLKQGNFFPLGNGRYLSGIGELVAVLAKHLIQRSTEADEQIKPAVRWVMDEIILKDTIRNLESGALSAEFFQEINRLREIVPIKEIPILVVKDLLTPKWAYLPIFYSLHPIAAMVGIVAYCEGAALAYCLFDNQFDSAETAQILRSYYMARRLGDARSAEGGAYALAVIQADRFPWSKFFLSDSDQELVEDDFIERFRQVFTDQPVESILNPNLCFGYILQAAGNAVKRRLSKTNKHVSIDERNIELWVSPPDEELVFVEAEPAMPEQQKLPAVIKLLPDYDSYLRYENQEVSLRKLATEQGRSHEAVRKSLKRFESQAKENLRLHGEADLAGWPPISAEVWAQIKPFIPKARNRDCYIMRGIAFKMNKGITWAELPKSETFRRYYQKWLRAGVFERIRQAGIELW